MVLSSKNPPSSFVRTSSEWGLSVSTKKTKGLAMSIIRDEDKTTLIQLDNGLIEMVEGFVYLGSQLTVSREIKGNVECRIAKAAKVF